MPLANYNPESFYDELFSDVGSPRPHAASLIQWMQNLPTESLQQHHETAQLALFNLGVTFRVYSDQQGVERIFPFDIIPRIIDADDWQALEKALKQRIKALNCFLTDIYGPQQINKRPRRKQRGIVTLFLTFHTPQGAGNLPVILLKTAKFP